MAAGQHEVWSTKVVGKMPRAWQAGRNSRRGLLHRAPVDLGCLSKRASGCAGEDADGSAQIRPGLDTDCSRLLLLLLLLRAAFCVSRARQRGCEGGGGM